MQRALEVTEVKNRGGQISDLMTPCKIMGHAGEIFESLFPNKI